MAEQADFYKSIIDSLYDGVYFVDRERVITYWNQGAERITGYKRGDVIGRSCGDNMLNHVSSAGTQLCLNGCPLTACMADGEPREADVFLHHADGHRVPVLVRAAPLRNEAGEIVGAVETFSRDLGLTSVREELRQLRRSAQTDALTGVSSRKYLMRRLYGTLAELHQQADANAAVLFIDIDEFKQFNDRYGHDVGDKVLCIVAATLRHSVRPTDVVARWGGDEFVVVLHDLPLPEGLPPIAEKLRMLVEQSRLDLPESSLSITVSIGGALCTASDTPESVLKRADEAMYVSKGGGRNRVSVE